MKILRIGAELLPEDIETDGWTDMKNLRVAFRKFAKAPKKEYSQKNQNTKK